MSCSQVALLGADGVPRVWGALLPEDAVLQYAGHELLLCCQARPAAPCVTVPAASKQLPHANMLLFCAVLRHACLLPTQGGCSRAC